MFDAWSIYLNDKVSAEELGGDHSLIKEVGVVCPFCSQDLLLKAGDKKAHHFSHRIAEEGDDCEARSIREEGREFIRNLQATRHNQLLRLFNEHLWDLLCLGGLAYETRLSAKDRGSLLYQDIGQYIEGNLLYEEGQAMLKELCFKYINEDFLKYMESPEAPDFAKYVDHYKDYKWNIRLVRKTYTDIAYKVVDYLGTSKAKLVRQRLVDLLYQIMYGYIKNQIPLADYQWEAFPFVRLTEMICQVPWLDIQKHLDYYLATRKAYTNSRGRGFG